MKPDDVRELLARKKLTQKELAERAGVAPNTLSLWMNGRRRLREDTKDRLMEALGVSEAPAYHTPSAPSPSPVTPRLPVDDASMRTFSHYFLAMADILRDTELSPQARYEHAYSFCIDCILKWGGKVITADGKVIE